MSGKTKNWNWLPWAVTGALVLGIGLGFMYFNWDNYLSPPWVIADGITTIIAVESFKTGIFEERIFLDKVIQAYIGLLVLFLVGPSLWIFSETKNQNRNDEDQLKKGWLWYVGTVIVVFGLFTAVAGSITNLIIYQNTWERAAISENEDKLRMQLMKMGFDAYQLYYLPAKMGGGEGSFQVASDENVMRPIQLEDLKHYSDSLANSFLLEQTDSAQTITIYGVGIPKPDDAEFKNINGDKGRVQLAVEVVPGEQIIQMK